MHDIFHVLEGLWNIVFRGKCGIFLCFVGA